MMDKFWERIVLFLFQLWQLTRVVTSTSCAAPYSCIGLVQCELLHANANGVDEVLAYCSNSRSKVCCPPSKTPEPFTPTPTSGPKLPLSVISPSKIANFAEVPKKNVLQHKNLKRLQQKCGTVETNKITSGVDATIGEFPWMALLGFKDRRGGLHHKCGGTLINDRYVLTAAHCLDKVDDTVLSHVRLGEFDLSEERDCLNPGYPDDCVVPLDISIDKQIPHEDWRGDGGSFRDDIALLKLHKSAPQLISGRIDIQPICLPINEDDVPTNNHTRYEATGWGLTSHLKITPCGQSPTEGILARHECNNTKDIKVKYAPQLLLKVLEYNFLQMDIIHGSEKIACEAPNHEQSDVLQKVEFTDNNEAECAQKCSKNSAQYCPISENQVCILGIRNRDVCKGDSGGPLMVRHRKAYQVGITSFSFTSRCGEDGVPSIFTRVSKYIPWILDNMDF